MSKLVTASIDVTKIMKSLLIKGEKGTYMNLSIWFNDTPDQFGNDCSIQQTTKKDEPKIFLGNGKFYKPKERVAPLNAHELPPNEPDDLPF